MNNYGNNYRPCPICRTNLSEHTYAARHENGIAWQTYVCQNCGSEIWIAPFRKVIEQAKA